MIWRVLVLFSVFTVFCNVDKEHGREAAWAASAVLTALLLPLGEIERRLSKTQQLMAEQKALLAKMLKGYL